VANAEHVDGAAINGEEDAVFVTAATVRHATEIDADIDRFIGFRPKPRIFGQGRILRMSSEFQRSADAFESSCSGLRYLVQISMRPFGRMSMERDID